MLSRADRIRDARERARERSLRTGRAWRVVTADEETFLAIHDLDAPPHIRGYKGHRTVATYRNGVEVETRA